MSLLSESGGILYINESSTDRTLNGIVWYRTRALPVDNMSKNAISSYRYSFTLIGMPYVVRNND